MDASNLDLEVRFVVTIDPAHHVRVSVGVVVLDLPFADGAIRYTQAQELEVLVAAQ
ncbi:hypothetical protein D3C72_2417050 [compost metagenome]